MIELYNGDCLEVMDLLIEQGVKVDAVITDPPYGTTACKWDTVIPLDKMWGCLTGITRPETAIVLHASQPFTSTLIMSNIKKFKYCWIWEKSKCGNFMQSGYQPLKMHEDIIVFSDGCATYTKSGNSLKYNPQMWGMSLSINKGQDKETALKTWRRRQKKNYTIKSTNTTGKKFPKSILTIKNDSTKFHPTQKPVALMEYLIKTYTNENEIVLDFTMGSGTTGVACVNTDRQFIGIEKEKKYFEIAEKRILDATGLT